MKEFKEKVKELRVVKLQGEVYLGIVKDKTLIDAIGCGSKFSKDDIVRWFSRYNVNDVYEEVQFAGAMGYTIRPFNLEESRHADQCLLCMEDSKKLALHQAQNDYFKKAMNSKEKKGEGDEEDE